MSHGGNPEAGPGGEVVQARDQVVARVGPVAGDHQGGVNGRGQRCQGTPGSTAAIACRRP
jgi:hypothetical protein